MAYSKAKILNLCFNIIPSSIPGLRGGVVEEISRQKLHGT
jgi:hypothetical protein